MSSYAEKRFVLERVLAAWDKVPHLRLGQLIHIAIDDDMSGEDATESGVANVMFDMADGDLASDVELKVQKMTKMPEPSPGQGSDEDQDEDQDEDDDTEGDAAGTPED